MLRTGGTTSLSLGVEGLLSSAGAAVSEAITSLQATGIPGQIRSFTAKTSGIAAAITALQVTGIPGQTRAFSAKSAADAVAAKYRGLMTHVNRMMKP